jgi:8-oxo-dGTP pyrophosphatase MutT (NUDIX family)
MVQKLSGVLHSRSLESVPLTTVTHQSCGALIYAANTRRFLFLLRNGAGHSGTWGIAGGKMQAQESVVQALHRELREELGQTFENNKLVPLETYTSSDLSFCYHTFILVVDQEFVPTLNNEHSGWAWTRLSDAPRPMHPGLFRTIKIKEINSKILTVDYLNS